MSLLVDILIVLLLLGCLVHGFRRGFIGSVGSIAGLVAGAIAAALVAPMAGALVPDAAWRPAAVVGTAALMVLIGTAVGSRIGGAIGRPLRRTPLGPLDRVLGAGVQVVVGTIAVVVLASLAVALGSPEVSRAVAGSVVVGRIDAVTPQPVAQALEGLRSMVA